MTKAKIMIGIGGVALATTVVVATSDSDTASSRPMITASAQPDHQYPSDFLKIYQLDPDENVRIVHPPFDEVRLEVYRERNPQQAEVVPQGPTSMVLHDTGEGLSIRSMSFNANDRPNLETLIVTGLGLSSDMVEFEDNLPSLNWPVDLVLRDDAPMPAILPELSRLISEDLVRPIRIKIENLPRQMWVMSGSPSVQGTTTISIGDPAEQAVQRYESVPWSLLLSQLSQTFDTLIEADRLPPGMISFNIHEDALRASRPDRFFQQVERQTGLSLRRESRLVPVVVVENAR